ncbi:MarR family winged helix-turn-helix transcriptional regulator [Kitasatospora mediocidica]|uniref:MarR family winged helix-turn-helix transcriptional regulator n=1 Tax=Kitasatospora mediocidica TaxID=58352 RepID=UPI0005698939|nr:MarR family transcriptional regulator [Kitasatospora mediocidica]
MSSPSDMSTPPDELSARAIGLFVAINRRYAGEAEAAAAAQDLTPLQAKALLATMDPVPMRAVADKLHAEPSNITAVVDRLEERGLVERRAAPGDRRVKLVAATDRGRTAIAELRAAMPFAGDPLGALGTEQREALCRLLELVVGPQERQA